MPFLSLSRPAKLASFAVVNFARENCNEYVNTVLRVSQSHGIEIPSTTMEAATQHLEDLSVYYPEGDAVNDVSHTFDAKAFLALHHV